MSENTSDSAHDTSGVDVADMNMSDSEPSMEDILSSIRQIIADDKTEALVEVDSGSIDNLSPEGLDETSADNQSTSENIDNTEINDPKNAGAELEGEIVAPVTDSEADILDLMNLVDNNAGREETIRSVSKNNRVDESTSATLNFDESLDLVVDEDASSYVTTKIPAKTSQLDIEAISDNVSEPEQINEVAVAEDNTGDEPSLDETLINDEPHIVEQVDANIDDNQTNEAQDSLSEEKTDDVFTEVFDEAAFMSEATSETLIDDNVEEVSAPPSLVLPEEIELPSANVTPDEDMDLVKSLLADLMEGPTENAFEDAALIEDSPPEMEERLPTIEDVMVGDVEEAESEVEIATIEPEIDFITGKAIDAGIVEVVKKTMPSVGEQTSVLDEILQQSVADEIAQHESLPVDAKPEKPTVGHSANEDDIVVLPKVDLDSKLSLLKKTASVAGLGTAAALLGRQGEDDDAQIEQKQAIEGLSEGLTENPVEDNSEILEALQENTNPEKDETMAQPAKSETLLDEGTVVETSSAFASLNTAVQEKTKMEESGPAIGDLVQEALKPMLKEWLDKNLKGIVERAVTKEVKRISSGK